MPNSKPVVKAASTKHKLLVVKLVVKRESAKLDESRAQNCILISHAASGRDDRIGGYQ